MPTWLALILGSTAVPAIVAGAVSLIVAARAQKGAGAVIDRKIAAERELTNRKFEHELSEARVERAWADYGHRRDVYLEVTERIDCLFDSNAISTPSEAAELRAARREFNRSCRKLRLIGSDKTVLALNALTSAIKRQKASQELNELHGAMMIELRRDIRTLNEGPAAGTALDASHFPIES